MGILKSRIKTKTGGFTRVSDSFKIIQTEPLILEIPYCVEIEEREKGMFVKKKIRLSLNEYRNMAYILNNKVKQRYKDWTLSLIAKHKSVFDFLKEGRWSLSYRIYAHNKKAFDVMNCTCVVDKYFLDGLVLAGLFKDDDYKVVSGADFKFGGFDFSREEAYITVSFNREQDFDVTTMTINNKNICQE